MLLRANALCVRAQGTSAPQQLIEGTRGCSEPQHHVRQHDKNTQHRNQHRMVDGGMREILTNGLPRENVSAFARRNAFDAVSTFGDQDYWPSSPFLSPELGGLGPSQTENSICPNAAPAMVGLS